MPRTRNPYPAEFREQIIALAHAGRGITYGLYSGGATLAVKRDALAKLVY